MGYQGRIDNAEKVPYSSKYPILLPHDHYLTKLYVLNAYASPTQWCESNYSRAQITLLVGQGQKHSQENPSRLRPL